MSRAERIFTEHDQRQFAALSGDYNPIHMDPIAARRLLFGEPVVHGIHLVLWALSKHQNIGPDETFSSLKVDFIKPVPIGTSVECLYSVHEEASRFEVQSKGKVVTKISVTWQSNPRGQLELIDTTPPVQLPLDWDATTLPQVEGDMELQLDQKILRFLVPEIKIASAQVALLLAVTRLVGTYYPGLNSVFSNLIIRQSQISASDKLHYNINPIDKRFNKVDIQLQCLDWEGVATAFIRPRPILQQKYIAIAQKVIPREFSGLDALVIGGSRGLGEVATKVLCAGGASVTITYNQGNLEADTIVNEITEFGGHVKKTKLDITTSTLGHLPTPDVLIFCSTPFIFSATRGEFDSDLFRRFCDFYVDAFKRLCEHFGGKKLVKILYPSTTALDSFPENMGEYAAAKAAGEALCCYLEKCHRHLIIHRPRLPRLSTDQTASFLPVENNDPVPILLNELRDLLSRNNRRQLL